MRIDEDEFKLDQLLSQHGVTFVKQETFSSTHAELNALKQSFKLVEKKTSGAISARSNSIF